MGQAEARGGHGAESLALEVALTLQVLGIEGNLLTENEQWAKLRPVIKAACKVGIAQ
jgi:hypothetical protein